MTTTAAPLQTTNTKPIRLPRYFVNIAIGVIFMIVNFPDSLARLTQFLISNQSVVAPLVAFFENAENLIQGATRQMTGDRFVVVMATCFVSLAGYFFVLALFSMRHGRVFMGFGIGGVISGVISLHLFAWLLVIAFWLFQFAMYLFAQFSRFSDWLNGYLQPATTRFFEFIFSNFFLIAGIAVATFLIYLAFTNFRGLLNALGVIALAVLAWLFLPVLFTPIIEFWQANIAQSASSASAGLGNIFGVIGDILGAVVGGLIALVVLLGGVLILLIIPGVLGHLVIDELKSALQTGRNARSILMSAIGIGLAIALIFIVSIGNSEMSRDVNRAWVQQFLWVDDMLGTELAPAYKGHSTMTNVYEWTLPALLTNLLSETTKDDKAPAVDALILLTILLITTAKLVFGVLNRIVPAKPTTNITFLPGELISLVTNIILGVVLVVVGSVSED